MHQELLLYYMRVMRAFFTIILMTISLSLYAQKDKITAQLKSMGSSVVEFTLDVTSGVADIQYPCFRVITAESTIYGDGKTMWIYYPKAEEVIISNSMLEGLLGEATLGKDSKGRVIVTLSGNEGSTATLTVTSSTPYPQRWDASHFILDVNALGEDVIVTDMR